MPDIPLVTVGPTAPFSMREKLTHRTSHAFCLRVSHKLPSDGIESAVDKPLNRGGLSWTRCAFEVG